MTYVLKRKVDEELRIGGNVNLRIVQIGRRYVRIAIEAPQTIEVIRGERAVTNEDDEEEPTCLTTG